MRLPKNVWDQKRGIWQPRISEEHVLREIVTRLSWAKIKIFRINCPVGGKMRPNEPGLPDLIGVSPKGISIFLEVKRPGGARRPAQIRFIEEVKSFGAIAGFCDSWESVRKLFREHEIELPE